MFNIVRVVTAGQLVLSLSQLVLSLSQLVLSLSVSLNSFVTVLAFFCQHLGLIGRNQPWTCPVWFFKSFEGMDNISLACQLQ
jgi:hypothetical protein